MNTTATLPMPRFAIGDHVKAVAIPNGIPQPCSEKRGFVVVSRRIIGPSMPNTPQALAPYWRYEVNRRTDYTHDHDTHTIEGAERFFKPED